MQLRAVRPSSKNLLSAGSLPPINKTRVATALPVNSLCVRAGFAVVMGHLVRFAEIVGSIGSPFLTSLVRGSWWTSQHNSPSPFPRHHDGSGQDGCLFTYDHSDG